MDHRQRATPPSSQRSLNNYVPPPTDTPSDDDNVVEKPTARDVEPETQLPPSQPPAGPGPPPNGGLLAWLHVLGGFMLFFNSWGLLNTFGVFQTYYESGQLFQKSSSDISWIGSIQAFCVMFVGIFAGPVYDRGYLKALLFVGSFGIVFGNMMLSLCHEFWEVLLAQGFCIGIGAGCLFVPCVSVLPSYFSTRIGLAVGVAASGSSLGGIIYPIVVYKLIGEVGFPWAVRTVGFIALGTLLFPIAIMRMRVKPPRARALVDLTAIKDVQYVVFTVSTLVGIMGLGVALFFVSFYPQNRHITDDSLAFYIVPIFNAGSCFGRTLPNALADKAGPFNVLAPATLATGVLMLCTIAVHTKGAMIVVALLLGFTSGVQIAMPPVCFVALTKDKSKIGTRMGMGFGVAAFGVLTAGPAGGAILGQTDPLTWDGLWAYGGVSACVAGLVYFGLRVARAGFGLTAKG